MIRYNILIITFLSALFLFASSCKAQKNGYSTKNKKAQSLFEEAMKSYRLLYFDKSMEKLDEALEKDDKFIEAYVLKAQIFAESDRPEEAVAQFEKAVSIDPDYEPRIYYELGLLQNHHLMLDEAERNLKKFLAYEKELSVRARKMGELELELVEFRKELVNNPVPFDPVNLGSGVNGRYFEHSPTLRGDEKVLYFTKNEAPYEGARRDDYTENIFYSERMSDGSWGNAVKMSNEINSKYKEGAAAISPDGNYLIFTSCQRPDGFGSCDLYIAVKRGDQWVNARNLGSQINTRHWESQPSFASDGRTLYFVSNRSGGPGKKDIFMSKIGDDGKWSKPKSISLNTPGDDVSPYTHPDDKTFYFSSDGYPGLGMRDMFVVEKFAADSFGEPRNLGYPINSPGEEVSLSVAPSGKVAYYASGREGGMGGWDIYSFELPEYARPTPVTYAKGKVRDKKTGKPLRVRFELLELGSGERIVESFSDPETGEFLVVIPADKGLALNASGEGYLFFSENFEPAGSKGSPYIFDVAMEPIEEGKSVVLKNIFFETDKYDLKGESKAELGKLVEFMNDNPSLHIEIGGHTDNVGSKAYNKELSENRAKSVYDYLIDGGISADRLSYKGYDFSMPVASNDTEEGRAENRRTEFKIVKK